MQCQNVTLTITEKANGKVQKLKGKIWVNAVNMNFINGYKFKASNGVYFIDLRSNNTLELWNKAENQMKFQEELIVLPDSDSF